jgi:hypothetical protein
MPSSPATTRGFFPTQCVQRDGIRCRAAGHGDQTAWLGWKDSNSEMSTQIISSKDRTDCGNPSEFWLWRLFAFELRSRQGCWPVFLASLFSTTAATILLGLLPPYESWSVAAPLLLVSLRLIQGICLGGELPGALTYAVEAAPNGWGLPALSSSCA